MNEQPSPNAETASPVSAFQQMARDTLTLAGAPRSLALHVVRLRSEIASLRADGVGWKWLAEEIRQARGDADAIGYAGTMRAAYARAYDRDIGEFDDGEFLVQVQATLKNAAGTRKLPDQVGRLTAAIAAARAAGVDWQWLAEKLAIAREYKGDVGTFSIQLRRLYQRIKAAPKAATASSSMLAASLPHNPVPQPQPAATPPHVAAVAPPRPVPPSVERTAGATDRIRARSRRVSF